MTTGQYDTVEALISEALSLLANRQQKLAELHQQIAIGTEQIRNGQAILHRMHSQSNKRNSRGNREVESLENTIYYIKTHSDILF